MRPEPIPGAGPILAIELSQRLGGVAVARGGLVLARREVVGGRRDRDELLPAIAEVLDEGSVAARELEVVAVDVGPGGFSGLRVSITAAQALAEVSGAAVVGVPGAEVAVGSTIDGDGDAAIRTVDVISATKSGTAWSTRLRKADDDVTWSTVGTPGLIDRPTEEMPDVLLADEHLDPSWRSVYRGAGVEIREPMLRPEAIVDLVARHHGQSPPSSWVHSDDAASLRPLYPRDPEAVRLWRARSGR